MVQNESITKDEFYENVELETVLIKSWLIRTELASREM